MSRNASGGQPPNPTTHVPATSLSSPAAHSTEHDTYLDAFRDLLPALSTHPDWNSQRIELGELVSTYPQTLSSVPPQTVLGNPATHTAAPATTLDKTRQQTPFTASPSTQHYPAATSAQRWAGYPDPDSSHISSYPPPSQYSPSFDHGTQRGPDYALPSTAQPRDATYNRGLDPQSPTPQNSGGTWPMQTRTNPNYTPQTGNTPESQYLPYTPPGPVPYGPAEDMTMFADLSENNQNIHPDLLPPPESSPLASRDTQAKLGRLTFPFTSNVSATDIDVERHDTDIMDGNTEPSKQDHAVPEAKVAQNNRRKANSSTAPELKDPLQDTAAKKTTQRQNQDSDLQSVDGRQNKRSKRNPRGPEGGYWCPDPDCPQRRKSISTMDIHITSYKDHPWVPQPAPAPGSKVQPRPNLPTSCQECCTNFDDWQHSWRHTRQHQQNGMSKKTYLTKCRFYSQHLFAFNDTEVPNPDAWTRGLATEDLELQI